MPKVAPAARCHAYVEVGWAAVLSVNGSAHRRRWRPKDLWRVRYRHRSISGDVIETAMPSNSKPDLSIEVASRHHRFRNRCLR